MVVALFPDPESLLMTPLLGFVPDVDPGTAGAIVDCTNVVPGPSGMEGAPTAIAVDGVPALDAACRGAVVVTKLDDTRRVFGATAAAIFELSGGAWASRASGFTLGSEDRWDFVQFLDSTLAATPTAAIQRSASTTFSAIAGAPQAKILEVCGEFVIAFNTNAGADVWHCCARLDETDWALSEVTQSTTGQLVSTPGPITAAKTFGSSVMVYKDRSMYRGTEVGGAAVWQFDLLPVDIGCIGPDAVTDLGGAGHIFVGRSDIFQYDGTMPVSIAEGAVRQWFYDNVSQQYIQKTTVVHDKQNGVVWIFYPSTNSTVCDQALVYHLGQKKWGRCTQTIEAALNYVSAGATIDGLTGTIDTLPDVSFDSQYWLAGGRMMTVYSSAHQLSTMTGNTATSSMTLFDVGDDAIVSRLSRLRVAYQSAPTSATVTGFIKMTRGEAVTAGGSGTYSSGKFDIRQAARFHRLRVDAVGSWVTAMVDFDFMPAGQR